MFSVDSDQDYRQMNEHLSIEHQVQRTCAECREPFWMAVSGEYQAIVLCDRCLSRAEQAAQVRGDMPDVPELHLCLICQRSPESEKFAPYCDNPACWTQGGPDGFRGDDV